MMRSMFSGVSGLRQHQTKMDVIANNISNVNTMGYKASRVTFKEVFAQTTSGASAPNADTGRGGTNPMQIGLGVGLGSIDKVMTQGASQRTDITSDLMIEGDGFFIVSDETGTFFTRAGAMDLDMNGNLVLLGSGGLTVNGWYAEPETRMVEGEDGPIEVPTGNFKINKGEARPIQISGPYEYIDPEVTTRIEYGGNLNAVSDPEKVTTVEFYDSLGTKYTLNVRFLFNADDSEWEIQLGNYLYRDGQSSDPIFIGTPNENGGFDQVEGTADFTYTSVGNMKFDSSGNLLIGEDGFLSSLTINIATGEAFSPDSVFNEQGITIDFSSLRQVADRSNATSTTIDGSAPGMINGWSIGSDGIITGRYSNGQTRAIAQIALADFVNPAGLEKVGNNLFQETVNSGRFDGVGTEVQALGGNFIVGSLEMSNVDLSSEFTEMITTQRGFQANSRIISTSDEILQELVNLKR